MEMPGAAKEKYEKVCAKPRPRIYLEHRRGCRRGSGKMIRNFIELFPGCAPGIEVTALIKRSALQRKCKEDMEARR
jgi:hypothetical protein